MTNYVKDASHAVRELKVAARNWPLRPSFSKDDDAPNIKRSEVRRDVQRRLKEKFPDLL